MWTKYKAFGEEYAKALARFDEAYDKYLKKFGENSLDRVLLSEPLIHQPTKLDIDETNKDTKMLEEAIENNKPLEQIPKEMWKKNDILRGENMNEKVVGNGILKDVTRLIIETDEENPVPIAIIDYNEIQLAKGYRARLKPNYKN